MSSPKYELIFSEQAKEDFRDILSYTAQMWGEQQAIIYGDNLNQAITAITENPLAGKKDFPPYLYVRAGKHLVFYHLQEHCVLVSRILHGKMDFPRHLDAER